MLHHAWPCAPRAGSPLSLLKLFILQGASGGGRDADSDDSDWEEADSDVSDAEGGINGKVGSHMVEHSMYCRCHTEQV